MVGSAIKRNIEKNYPSVNVLVADKKLKLRISKEVKDFFEHRPGIFSQLQKSNTRNESYQPIS